MKQPKFVTSSFDRATPFSYGWINVGASIPGNMMAFGVIVVFLFSTFIGPVTAEFGWSRSQISYASTAAHVTMILSLLFIVGPIIDKHGVRSVLIPSTLLFGLALCSLYFATSSIVLYCIIFAILGVVGSATGPVSYSRVIVDWFDKRRGLALGIGLSGIGLGAFFMPKIAHFFIEAVGWRGTYLRLGLGVIFIVLPLLFLLIRDKQETNNAGETAAQQGALSKLPGLSLTEAFRTSAFIKFLIVSFLIGFALSGVMQHYVPLLMDSGLNRGSAIAIVSNIGLALITGRIVAGYLMDRFFAPLVASIFFVGPVIGFLVLASSVSPTTGVIGALLIGAAFGAEFDVIAFITGRYFGRRSFGKLYAVLFSAFTIGSGLGPLMMGVTFDRFGSYTTGLTIASGALLLAIVVLMLMGAYPKFSEEGSN